MITLEQVEELRRRANISYDEAKSALEETDGDILEAIINLENQNRIKPPKGGGFYSTKNTHQNTANNQYDDNSKGANEEKNGTTFAEILRKFLRWCGKIIERGNRNFIQIIKDGNKIMTLPVTILVLLLVFAFWITIPLAIVGLFFGYKYRFSGPDLGKENINNAMDSVSNMADNLKKEVKGEMSNEEDSDN